MDITLDTPVIETADTQKQITQHIHKLLEKPEDWHCPAGNIWDWGICWVHNSGLRVRWDVNGLNYLDISFPGGNTSTFITDPAMCESFTKTFVEPKALGPSARKLLAFLESLPQ